MITSEERAQTETNSVTVERTISAPPADVYRAFVTPQALRDWFCNSSQVDPRVGGRIYLAWNSGYHTAGKFTRVEKNVLLAFTWRAEVEQNTSVVTVEIEGNEQGRSTVRVTHSAPGASRDWLDEAKRDWTEGLENLEGMLATGIDQRIARRPMFGMNGAEIVDDDLAAKHNLPVREGIRLTGLVEGMGAEKAGIQEGDVLVRLAGMPLVTFPDVGQALGKHRAGDTIEAELYRDGEKVVLPVQLTARANPELPETAWALADHARELYAETNEELDQLFMGATEKQADYRPAPEEWNSKEILAHLVASERDVHTWIASIAEDSDVQQVFHSNDNVRVQSIVAAHPTINDMVQELKNAQAEVVAAIEQLRPDAVARKHMFYQVAVWITTFQAHHRGHFALVKTMLEEAN